MAKKNYNDTKLETKSPVKADKEKIISVKQFINDFAKLSIPHNIVKDGFIAYLKIKKLTNERKTFSEWKEFFKGFLSAKLN